MRQMKDSGIEWIGEIPESWATKKLSYYFKKIGSGTTPDTANGYFYDGDYNWLQTGDLTDGYITSTSKRITQEAVDAYSALTFFKKGAVVIAMYGATIGKLGILDIDCFTNQACCALSEPKEANSKFVYYWLLCNRENIVRLSLGGGQPNISQGIITSLKVPAPTSVEEQTRIVTYLDQKCAEIDAIIAAKEKTNELLKERRQSIIYEAVTKGLDPTVPMKDSGVEWIGEIPESWSVVALKRVAKPSTGMTPNKANPEYWDGDIPWFSSKDIKDFYLTDSEDHITEKAIEDCGLTLYDANSVVFCARSGILRHTFPVAVMKCQGTINQDLRVLTTANSVDSDFLMYYLRGMNNTIVTLYQKIGATVESIETDWLLYLPTVLPPIEEQRTIANGITARCDEINNLITTNNTSIQKLKEYRQSVIYEAVTGKVEI